METEAAWEVGRRDIAVYSNSLKASDYGLNHMEDQALACA